MVIGCKSRNGNICWQIVISIQVVLCIFVLALTVSEILTFLNFDLHKVRESNFFTMTLFEANVKIYKCATHTFMLALTNSKIYKLKCLPSKNRSRSQYNFRNDTIRWQISKSTNVSHTFLC